MPPFIPLEDGALVEIGFGFPEGLVVENLLWFVNRQPPTTLSQLQSLSDGVAAWHVANILPGLASQLELVAVLAEKWDVERGDIFARTDVNLSGGNSSGCHSANVSIRVPFGWPLEFRYLEENSNFVAGIPYDAIDTNVCTQSFQDVLFEAYAALIDAAAVFGPFPAWRWVVTSRRADGDWRATQFWKASQGPRFKHLRISPRRHRITNLRKLPP